MKYKPRTSTECSGLKFEFPFKIEPKQSARFVGKRVLKSAKVRQFEDKVNSHAEIQHTYQNKRILTGAIHYVATYYYTIPTSHYKWAKDAVKEGKKVYKETQPDATDNLNKGIVDAIAPMIMGNDGKIAKVTVEKVYSTEDYIECAFYELPNPF